MPCSDPGAQEYYDSKKIDLLTRLLCYVCTEMIVGTSWDEAIENNLELSVWWREHQAIDMRRRAQERREQEVAEAKRTALAKLTPQERALLGFKYDE